MRDMKRLATMIGFAVLVFSSCQTGNGELIGVQGRPEWYGYDPLDMQYIAAGSFQMGQSDQDVPFTQQNKTKTVTVSAFYMDHTEITNNEYRQFVYWVRDSIAMRYLAEEFPEEFLLPTYDDELEEKDEEDWNLDWDVEIDWEDPDFYPILMSEMVLPENQRFYGAREVDVRKLTFDYYWIDFKAAAQKGRPVVKAISNTEYEDREEHRLKMKDEGFDFPVDQYDEEIQQGRDLDLGWRNSKGQNNAIRSHSDRSRFIIHEQINVYPDTLVWVNDFSYSYNEPYARQYFSSVAYDDYPVVGITWNQAKAFCVWRTNLLNGHLGRIGDPRIDNFRLPSEAEWEYAARGGLDQSPYPWGGPYIRNSKGCFLGNFKPMRGRYMEDGGTYTVKVTSYHPNDYGLYCMAGNVAEWTNTAYDESMYEFSHDLNPEYEYNALDHDPISMKRKVIRGGSWKDIGYYLQTGSRTYEYQDTAKSYIGFRCVSSYLGRGGNEKGGDVN